MMVKKQISKDKQNDRLMQLEAQKKKILKFKKGAATTQRFTVLNKETSEAPVSSQPNNNKSKR